MNDDLGLSWLRFEHPTFRLRGVCSSAAVNEQVHIFLLDSGTVVTSFLPYPLILIVFLSDPVSSFLFAYEAVLLIGICSQHPLRVVKGRLIGAILPMRLKKRRHRVTAGGER